MRLIFLYADLVGGFLGILGSIVLGWPFITEASERHQWELLKSFKERQGNAAAPLTPAEWDAFRSLRDQLIDERLGQHQQYRSITIAGFALLLIAFVFMTIASVERAFERREHAPHAPPGSAAAAGFVALVLR